MTETDRRTSMPLQTLLRGLVVLSLVLWGIVCFEVFKEVGHPFVGFRYEQNLAVSPQNLSSWNGPQSGLKSYDRLLSANGLPLRTRADLRRLIANVPAGTPIRYEIRRKGQTLSVTVPVQILNWGDVFRGFGMTLLIGLLHILIGGLVFWIRPAAPAAQAHLYLTLSLGLGLQTFGIDFTMAHWFSRLYLLGVALLGSTCVHLSLVFPEPIPALRRHPWLIGGIYLPSLLFALASEIDYRPMGLAASPAPLLFGDLLPVWGALTAAGFITLAVRLIALATRSKHWIARRQALMVLAGAVLGYLPGMAAYVLPIMFKQTTELSMLQINMAYACCILFPLSVAYSILRHQLFGISMVVKRTVTYALVSTCLTILYFLLIHLANNIIGLRAYAGNILAIMLLTLVFAPLQQWAQWLIERWFFRVYYQPQQIMAAFGETARELRDPPQIVKLFVEKVQASLQPSALLILLRSDSGLLQVAAAHGVPAEVIAALDEGVSQSAAIAELAPFLEGLSFPMRTNEQDVGVFLLGPRKSGQFYNEQDRLFLSNFSQQLTVWLRNAQLFKHVEMRNAELMEANQYLQELDRLKSNFLSAASHELRTPLASITGYSEFLEDGLGGPLTPEQSGFVAQIQLGTGRLLRLVDDLLDFARLEAGIMTLHPQPANLGSIVPGVLEGLRPQAHAVHVELHRELLAEDMWVMADVARVEQVLSNLISNAIKFTPEGGQVTVALRHEAEFCRVEVRDNGIGIAAEHLPRLFQKFYQVDAGTTRKYGGTGLGLSISRAFVQALGGAIGVESEPGRGSLFWFTLPKERALDAVSAG